MKSSAKQETTNIDLCFRFTNNTRPVVQSVICLTTDDCLTADTGVASLIPGPVAYFRGDRS